MAVRRVHPSGFGLRVFNRGRHKPTHTQGFIPMGLMNLPLLFSMGVLMDRSEEVRAYADRLFALVDFTPEEQALILASLDLGHEETNTEANT